MFCPLQYLLIIIQTFSVLYNWKSWLSKDTDQIQRLFSNFDELVFTDLFQPKLGMSTMITDRHIILFRHNGLLLFQLEKKIKQSYVFLQFTFGFDGIFISVISAQALEEVYGLHDASMQSWNRPLHTSTGKQLRGSKPAKAKRCESARPCL